MPRKIFFIFIAIVFFVGAGYFAASFFGGEEQKNLQTANDNAVLQNLPGENKDTTVSLRPTQTQNVQTTKSIEQAVPFIVQAPFANWNDPTFQNACEESSIVMAIGWLNGAKTISSQDAQNKILDVVDFENKTFGYNADTDVFDVAKIFQQHFGKTVEVKENIAMSDIINEVENGNVVLVPAFGQALGNPNYTPPGPIAHMLVVIGYDPKTQKFITNDPGTKHGEGYQYDQNVLFDAIWEYHSGPGPLQVPIGQLKKAMVVVSK